MGAGCSRAGALSCLSKVNESVGSEISSAVSMSLGSEANSTRLGVGQCSVNAGLLSSGCGEECLWSLGDENTLVRLENLAVYPESTCVGLSKKKHASADCSGGGVDRSGKSLAAAAAVVVEQG